MKSLQSMINKDVTTTFPKIEEESILNTQHFDFIYAHSRYLYTILLDAP